MIFIKTMLIFLFTAPVIDIDIYDDKFTKQLQPNRPTTSSLTFMEATPKPLQCVITGGNPPPDVTVFIGRRDVTAHFHVQTLPQLSGQKGFRLMRTTTVLWSDSFMVGRQDDGKRIKCRATVAGMGSQMAVARIQVNC
jgi:hypothetical protein